MPYRSDARARLWPIVRLGLLCAVGLIATGCHTGTLQITVTTAADGVDATPGDGSCEITSGTGDCSLRAAIDEAQASPAGRVEILLPSGTYPLTLAGVDDANAVGDLDLNPTGALVILSQGRGARIDAAGGGGVLDIQSGEVVVEQIAVTGSSTAGITVGPDATFSMVRSTAHGNGGPGIAGAATSTVRLLHSTVAANAGHGMDANGTVVAGYSTITANGLGGLAGAGSTTLTASVVADQLAGPDCAAPVASNGFNLDSDGSCALASADDLTGFSGVLGQLSTDLVPHARPVAGSVLIDHIPPGAMCSGGLADWDQAGYPRPLVDGCDVGSIEGAQLGATALLPDPLTSPAGVPTATAGPISPIHGPQDKGDLMACMSTGPSPTLAPCEVGSSDGHLSVALIGDSHAQHWATALDTVAAQEGWRLRVMTRAGCPYTSVELEFVGTPVAACRDFNDQVRADLLADPPDVVLVTARDKARTVDGTKLSRSESRPLIVASYAAVWSELAGLGVQVIAIANVPTPPFNTKDCVVANPTALDSCAYVPTGEHQAVDLAAGQTAGVTLWDLNRWLCPSQPCSAVIGDVMIFRDNHHLTNTYTGSLAPRLREELTALIAAGPPPP